MDETGKDPQQHVGSPDEMADEGKTTIRLDDGLKADAQRCANQRGIKLAEFIRQAVAHYVAWTAAQKEAQNDEEPRD